MPAFRGAQPEIFQPTFASWVSISALNFWPAFGRDGGGQTAGKALERLLHAAMIAGFKRAEGRKIAVHQGLALFLGRVRLQKRFVVQFGDGRFEFAPAQVNHLGINPHQVTRDLGETADLGAEIILVEA